MKPQAESFPDVEVRPGAVLSLAPALLSLVAVFYLGTLNNGVFPHVDFKISDKVQHFFAFAFVQYTHFRALQYLRPQWSTRKAAVFSVISSSCLGVLLEFWQAFLPYRTAELWDAVADVLGAALAGYLCVRLLRTAR